MRATSDEIVGNLDAKGYLDEKGRICGEIPEPTFGHLRRSSMGYRTKDDAIRGNLIEGDLGNLAYVDHFGQNYIEDTFVCQKDGCMCRCHMRYE